MKIGIDIDNVISNFNEVLLNEFLIYDKTLRNSGIVNEHVYITRGMFDWTKEEQNHFYKNNIERIVLKLDTILDSVKYINMLKKEGHKIVIITGRDNGEYNNPYDMSIKWLNDKGINFDELILTNAYKHDKYIECKKNNIDVMIDDSLEMCKKSYNNGINTLIMDTPYNKNNNTIKRVYNWKEIYNYISNYKKPKIKVILDTDTYNECDDQFALAYMLKSQDIFDIKAISIAPYSNDVCGVELGLQNSYNEVLKIGKLLKTDLSNITYKGSREYLQENNCVESKAATKIIELALSNDKIYILAIGALTNIVSAINLEPKIKDKIEIIWLGGHSLLQDNNLEYNFRQDIKAARFVYESKISLTVIPCKNVASNLKTSIYELNHHLKDKNNLCNYLIEKFYNDGYHGVTERRVIWDISVIAYLINENWFKVKKISCPNIRKNGSYEITNNKHLITIVNDIDSDKIYNDLFCKLSSEVQNENK